MSRLRFQRDRTKKDEGERRTDEKERRTDEKAIRNSLESRQAHSHRGRLCVALRYKPHFTFDYVTAPTRSVRETTQESMETRMMLEKVGQSKELGLRKSPPQFHRLGPKRANSWP